MPNIASVIVCHCHGISDRRIESEMLLGATTVEAIGDRCGAGTNCGGCVPLIEHILERRLAALLDEATLADAPVESPVLVRSSVDYRRSVTRTRSATQVLAATNH